MVPTASTWVPLLMFSLNEAGNSTVFFLPPLTLVMTGFLWFPAGSSPVTLMAHVIKNG